MKQHLLFTQVYFPFDPRVHLVPGGQVAVAKYEVEHAWPDFKVFNSPAIFMKVGKSCGSRFLSLVIPAMNSLSSIK